MKLEAYLRTVVNDNVRHLFIKTECEICNKEENLHLHHITLFSELLSKTLENLELEYKDTSEYTCIELNNIVDVMLGKHLRIKYLTLCKECHIEIHNENRAELTNNEKYMIYRKKVEDQNKIKKQEKEKKQKEYIDNVLVPYVYKILNKKLFNDNREELSFHLANVTDSIDYRTKNIKPSTVERILVKELGLPFSVTNVKKETTGKFRNKRYIIILNNPS